MNERRFPKGTSWKPEDLSDLAEIAVLYGIIEQHKNGTMTDFTFDGKSVARGGVSNLIQALEANYHLRVLATGRTSNAIFLGKTPQGQSLLTQKAVPHAK